MLKIAWIEGPEYPMGIQQSACGSLAGNAMRCERSWRWLPTAALLAVSAASGRAGNLAITLLRPADELVFTAADSGNPALCYRVECSTSLVSGAWNTLRTAVGVAAGASVTTAVGAPGSTAFYRVAATSNSAAFVDGPYRVIDVSGGTSATSYAVSDYASAAAVPGGVTGAAYKTDRILLRLIPRGAFIMGSPSDELGRFNPAYIDETQHPVTLTADFYIGVFEVTQRQWELVMGDRPSWFTNAAYYATRPVERVSYYDIREAPANSDDPAVDWPNNSAVNANSFFGKLRAKTGLLGLDLPTKAQWECAGRAGTTTALNCGSNLTISTDCPNMSALGRYFYNGGMDSSANCASTGGTTPVGSYRPNAWGLYDMHGNVVEWCLDWYGTYAGGADDPTGDVSGNERSYRSGCFALHADRCRSAYRFWALPQTRDKIGGFRICGPVPGQS